jgi:hypothetical protein
MTTKSRSKRPRRSLPARLDLHEIEAAGRHTELDALIRRLMAEDRLGDLAMQQEDPVRWARHFIVSMAATASATEAFYAQERAARQDDTAREMAALKRTVDRLLEDLGECAGALGRCAPTTAARLGDQRAAVLEQAEVMRDRLRSLRARLAPARYKNDGARKVGRAEFIAAMAFAWTFLTGQWPPQTKEGPFPEFALVAWRMIMGPASEHAEERIASYFAGRIKRGAHLPDARLR